MISEFNFFDIEETAGGPIIVHAGSGQWLGGAVVSPEEADAAIERIKGYLEEVSLELHSRVAAYRKTDFFAEEIG
ncbi:MAG: hypothetical protein KDA64_08345 [Rhodospirillaceae bacterium]|nr:hypothetical protein [Rhodospirillaceae bacterium]